MSETLCWKCARATGGQCSWSKNFRPVKGWKAVETVLHNCAGHGGDMKSYSVIYCPLFVPDGEPVKTISVPRVRVIKMSAVLDGETVHFQSGRAAAAYLIEHGYSNAKTVHSAQTALLKNADSRDEKGRFFFNGYEFHVDT